MIALAFVGGLIVGGLFATIFFACFSLKNFKDDEKKC